MSYITNKRIFYINSRNRISGTNSDFTYMIQLSPNEKYDRVCVLSAMIPKSYYLVQSPFNTFTLTEDLSSTIITIPEGNYGATSFKNTLITQLNNNSPKGLTYNVTIPTGLTIAQTGKYTYTTGSEMKMPISFTFDGATKIYEQMGFDASSQVFFSAGTLTSPNVIKMQTEDTIMIHSDICTNGQDDILQEIFGSAPDFSSIKYQAIDILAYSKILTTQNNNVYRFTITDEDGKNINLNGCNVVIVLCVFKVNNIYDTIQDYIKIKLLENI